MKTFEIRVTQLLTGYYEGTLSVELDDFDDEIHNYYSQL